MSNPGCLQTLSVLVPWSIRDARRPHAPCSSPTHTGLQPDCHREERWCRPDTELVVISSARIRGKPAVWADVNLILNATVNLSLTKVRRTDNILIHAGRCITPSVPSSSIRLERMTPPASDTRAISSTSCGGQGRRHCSRYFRGCLSALDRTAASVAVVPQPLFNITSACSAIWARNQTWRAAGQRGCRLIQSPQRRLARALWRHVYSRSQSKLATYARLEAHDVGPLAGPAARRFGFDYILTGWDPDFHSSTSSRVRVSCTAILATSRLTARQRSSRTSPTTSATRRNVELP